MERISLNGVKVFPFDSKTSLFNYIEKHNKGVLIAVNGRKIMTSPEDIKKMVNSNIGYIDGYGAIWAIRRKGFRGKVARMPGVELWLNIIERFMEKKIYLIGSKQETIEKVVDKLKIKYPNISVVGFRNGYFRPDEFVNIVDDIKDKSPDIIFVAMGSPLQEKVIMDLYESYKALYMGLGGSFDVFSGTVKRAPKIFQLLGMEGFYRFSTNPRRLFDRKIFYLDYFWKLILGKF